jgi:hypothetical protein
MRTLLHSLAAKLHRRDTRYEVPKALDWWDGYHRGRVPLLKGYGLAYTARERAKRETDQPL